MLDPQTKCTATALTCLKHTPVKPTQMKHSGTNEWLTVQELSPERQPLHWMNPHKKFVVVSFKTAPFLLTKAHQIYELVFWVTHTHTHLSFSRTRAFCGGVETIRLSKAIMLTLVPGPKPQPTKQMPAQFLHPFLLATLGRFGRLHATTTQYISTCCMFTTCPTHLATNISRPCAVDWAAMCSSRPRQNWLLPVGTFNELGTGSVGRLSSFKISSWDQSFTFLPLGYA